ncbi:hypothetical protein E3E38_06825 [Thermococcus sp. 18S1]|uniref:hypothetical protein n=1 Tax=Thermococcus sp. 18S1 TaxID=1638210 RepID=UPI00143A32D4|nr:hypothetical protein [Thermococcus sp. 18S1]NJE30755.1 hypothetical protein [Thermococcus sp. 18S1]
MVSMPIILEKTEGKPLDEALKDMQMASKVMVLDELMAIYTEWVSMVSEVLVGPYGLRKDIGAYRVDSHYKIMDTMAKVYATSDAYKALDELIRGLTQE